MPGMRFAAAERQKAWTPHAVHPNNSTKDWIQYRFSGNAAWSLIAICAQMSATFAATIASKTPSARVNRRFWTR